MKFRLLGVSLLFSIALFASSCSKSACCSDGNYTICENDVDAATYNAAAADCAADPACSCD